MVTRDKQEEAQVERQPVCAVATTERGSAPSGRCDSLLSWEMNHEKEDRSVLLAIIPQYDGHEK